ncbi:MAG: hypothetical protein V7K53_25790 [Nostoc sp.]|uniref:hypothetical protein n=1 Tax=Nostoc sp. TaxID=1180 RepID=UPI002FF4F303
MRRDIVVPRFTVRRWFNRKSYPREPTKSYWLCRVNFLLTPQIVNDGVTIAKEVKVKGKLFVFPLTILPCPNPQSS